MKNKIIIGVFLAIFIFMSIFNFNVNVYAADYSNKFVEISVPDEYNRGYSNETDTDVMESYYTEYTSIQYNVYERIGTKTKYTQEDIDDLASTIKANAAENDGLKIKEIYAGIIENNGCLGMRYAYKRYRSENGSAEYIDTYYFLTDNYDVTLEFVTHYSDYINSDEQKQIVRSFKIKDTVLESRGIPFTDVSSDSWYEGAVKYNYQNKIIKGLNDYTFAPEQELTRGMLVTILHRMQGSPYVLGTSKFPDVQNTTQYYYVAVKWATQNGIVSGYNNGNFGPDDPITREQIAVILNNYCRFEGKYKATTVNLSQYKDGTKISDYAKWGMNWAVGSGVITGTTDGYLNSQETATRAEVASMIYKYCLNIK